MFTNIICIEVDPCCSRVYYTSIAYGIPGTANYPQIRLPHISCLVSLKKQMKIEEEQK